MQSFLIFIVINNERKLKYFRKYNRKTMLLIKFLPPKYLFTAFLLVILKISYAEEDIPVWLKHDISIQYGRFTTPEIFDAMAVEVTSDSESHIATLERTNKTRSGGYYATYRYFFIPEMSIALTGGYNRIWSDLQYGGTVYGECIRDYYTIGVEWNVHYLRYNFFRMYSGGGIAATFIFEDNAIDGNYYYEPSGSRVYPNFNFTFAGVRFGSKGAIFLETGFGYKGVISGGISVQF